ncbi:MAG: MFS transporter [Clostridia bacterium]|nr:MFS transporter [Clostridia bacterium]
MKLNVKRTILVGFAFLSISAFWQMYDNKIPLILQNTFGLNETITGTIMAADNILALFLLPFFGGLSDRCQSRMGKRKPYILVGTLLATALMIILPIIDNKYDLSPTPTLPIIFIVVLALTLIAMGTYRSPAVALMPDVTPKPLRSKGNAIINLMGAIGGVLFLIVNTVIYSGSKISDGHINYLPIFLVVAGIMLVSLIIIMFFVNEPKLAAEQAEYEAAHPEEQLTEMDDSGKKEIMPRPVRKSLIFLLLSVAFWYIGYNAVTTWFSVYATNQWDMSDGNATLCLTIATVGAIASYIPSGVIAGKIGRAKTIKIGAALLSSAFAVAFIYTLFATSFHWSLYTVFVAVGIAWALINVNSLPMVVEMCSGGDIGKFTGYYYAFSMSAQVITPILSGTLYRVNPKTLFIYAAVAVLISFTTMLFVKHGDSKFQAKTGLEAFDMED